MWYVVIAFIFLVVLMVAWVVIFRRIASEGDESSMMLGAIYLFGVVACVVAAMVWPLVPVVAAIWTVGWWIARSARRRSEVEATARARDAIRRLQARPRDVSR